MKKNTDIFTLLYFKIFIDKAKRIKIKSNKNRSQISAERK